MKLDLQLEKETLPVASDVVMSPVVGHRMEGNTSLGEFLSLQEILRDISPLPANALFLGLADDGLPVLLDLWNATPGPILIAGDSQVGKTAFLKTITNFVNSACHPREVQYGVITNHTCEWADYAGNSHCLGIFSTVRKSTTDFINALAAWIEINQTSRQSVLLLIDGLNDFIDWNSGLEQELQRILLYGPSKKIWPVVTVNLEAFQNEDLLKYFHTRVFGYTKYASAIHEDGYFHPRFENLSKGIEFCVKKNLQWIKFRIPRT